MTQQAAPPEMLTAQPAKDPGVRLFIVAGLCLAFTAWLVIDGYILKKYPYAPPGEDINDFLSWTMNTFGPFITGPIGLAAAAWGVMFFGRKCVLDQEGIAYRYFNKPKLAWGDVAKLDATRLKTKQILELHFAGDERITLDGWKIEGFRDVVAFVERHVPADKIVT